MASQTKSPDPDPVVEDPKGPVAVGTPMITSPVAGAVLTDALETEGAVLTLEWLPEADMAEPLGWWVYVSAEAPSGELSDKPTIPQQWLSGA